MMKHDEALNERLTSSILCSFLNTAIRKRCSTGTNNDRPISCF